MTPAPDRTTSSAASDPNRDPRYDPARAPSPYEERSAARIRRRHRLGALLSPPYTCRHGKRLRAVAFNAYRGCGYSCGTTEPERWWHKLGWKLTAGRFDPFGRTASGRKPW